MGRGEEEGGGTRDDGHDGRGTRDEGRGTTNDKRRRRKEGGGRREEKEGGCVGRSSQTVNGRCEREAEEGRVRRATKCGVCCCGRRRDREEVGKEGDQRKRRRSVDEGERERRGWVRGGIRSSAEKDK